MPTILIIGATRGLGASLAETYALQPSTTILGTTRKGSAPTNLNPKIQWVKGLDVSQESCGRALVNGLRELGVKELDIVIVTAGYFATESWEEGPKWEEEVKMYSSFPHPQPNQTAN